MRDIITTEVVDSTIEFEEAFKSSRYAGIIDIYELKYLLEDKMTQIVFRVFDYAMQEYDFITIPLSELDEKKLRKMLKDRAYPYEDFKMISKYINFRLNFLLQENDMRKGALIVKAHRTLGWAKYNGEIAFYADQIYTESRVIASEYVGDKKIQPQGELVVFTEMLKTCVCGNTAMEAVCAMAAAATVLAFANLRWNCKFNNPINHLVETSSAGKTTAADLAVSFGAAPEEKDSCQLTYQDTDNALIEKMENNNGYPVRIDELSSSGRKVCTNLVYSIANGIGKSRCIAGGTKVSKAGEFHTVIISTGETGLIKKCAKTDGINARAYEFDVRAWTRSGDESRHIESIIRNNYGLITPLIANELLKNSDKWEEVLNKWKNDIMRRMEDEKRISVIGDRVVNIVALYITSCEILNDILNVRLDVSEVYEFFYLQIIVAKTTDMGLGTRAYDAVIRHYKRYRNERYVDGDVHLSSLSVMKKEQDYNIESGMEGFVVHVSRVHKSKDDRLFSVYIVFLEGMLEEILENNNCDSKVALKCMHREGLLKTKDANRDYMELSINGIKEKVHAVWVQDASYFDIPTEDDYDAEADEA